MEERVIISHILEERRAQAIVSGLSKFYNDYELGTEFSCRKGDYT